MKPFYPAIAIILVLLWFSGIAYIGMKYKVYGKNPLHMQIIRWFYGILHISPLIFALGCLFYWMITGDDLKRK